MEHKLNSDRHISASDLLDKVLSKVVQGIRLDKPGIYSSESYFSIGLKLYYPSMVMKKTWRNVLIQRRELLVVD